jgi:hypothetical protein
MLRLFAWSLLVVFLSTATLLAQCVPNIHPVQGQLGYRHRLKPDRCEGIYSALLEGKTLEFLSFLRGTIMFDPRADHALVITAPDVSTLGIREIAIRARPLAPSIFYRLDASVGSAGSFQWPVGEVAIPSGIDLNNIGITGSFATGQHTIYVALLVKPSNPGTSSGTEPPVMIFRALADIDSLQWRIVPSKGEPTTWNRYGRRVLAGDRIILKPDLAAGQTMTFQIS